MRENTKRGKKFFILFEAFLDSFQENIQAFDTARIQLFERPRFDCPDFVSLTLTTEQLDS